MMLVAHIDLNYHIPSHILLFQGTTKAKTYIGMDADTKTEFGKMIFKTMVKVMLVVQMVLNCHIPSHIMLIFD